MKISGEFNVKTGKNGSRGIGARQSGIGTLLFSIVMLGIATIIVVFSLSYNVYEQRTATSETRYKLAHEAAQAGLDQGLEYIKAMSNSVAVAAGGVNGTAGWLPVPGQNVTGNWEYCAATDRTSPCGSVEPTKASSSIRANYMRYKNGNAYNLSMADNAGGLLFVDNTGKQSAQAVTSMGNFSIDYEVDALLCLKDTVTPSNVCHTSSWFNTNAPQPGTAYQGTFMVTLVSRSRLVAAGATNDTENAQSVLKASTSSYQVVAAPPDVPLAASSSVTGLGNAEIVANPNGGGIGIPLSIWTPGCIHVTKADTCGGSSNASFATCQRDEFFQTGGANTGTCNAPSTGAPCNYEGTTTCAGGGKGCSCSAIANIVGNNKTPYGLGALSGHYGTNTVAGPDLLGVGIGGILPDNQYFPLTPLNSKLGTGNGPPYDNTPFEYLFSTRVADTNSVLLPGANDKTIDAATDYELTQGFLDAGDCSGLNSGTHGFYMTVKGVGCNLPGAQIGTPENPVTLVVQGDLTLGAGTTFFGIIFVRSSAGIGESVATSASYSVTANGGPQLYGAMIVEGQVSLSGNPQLIYDANTLRNIINNADNTRLGVLPGSWSDAGRIDAGMNYSE